MSCKDKQIKSILLLSLPIDQKEGNQIGTDLVADLIKTLRPLLTLSPTQTRPTSTSTHTMLSPQLEASLICALRILANRVINALIGGKSECPIVIWCLRQRRGQQEGEHKPEDRRQRYTKPLHICDLKHTAQLVIRTMNQMTV